MVGTQRRDIKWNLNDDFFKDVLNLRNKLLLWRFRNYFKIYENVDIGLNVNELEPRVQQIVNSFVTLFSGNPVQMEEFKKYILNYQEDLVEERRTSFDGEIVEAIYELVQEGMTDICAKDIITKKELTGYDDKPLKPKTLSNHLKSLGFGKAVLKWLGDGKVKRVIPMEQKLLVYLFKRYGLHNAITNITHTMLTPEINKNPKNLVKNGEEGVYLTDRNIRYDRYGENQNLGLYGVSNQKTGNEGLKQPNVTNVMTVMEQAKPTVNSVTEEISYQPSQVYEIMQKEKQMEQLDFIKKFGNDMAILLLRRGDMTEKEGCFLVME
jgi:hypothetical protein